MPSRALKLKPLSREDNAFLDSLLDELKVSNPKWIKLKLRYLFVGLEGYYPEFDAKIVKSLLPHFPERVDEAKKVKYINKALRTTRKVAGPNKIDQIYETIALRRRKLSTGKRQEFLGEVKSLSSATLKLQEALDNPLIRSFFENHSEEDHYDDAVYPYRGGYRSSVRALGQLQLMCIAVQDRYRQPRGRPSHDDLVGYVVEIAKVYEHLSKKKFTVFRHLDRSQGGRAIPHTSGHKFVQKILAWTEKQDFGATSKTTVFTTKNIYNACEAAQKILGNK